MSETCSHLDQIRVMLETVCRDRCNPFSTVRSRQQTASCKGGFPWDQRVDALPGVSMHTMWTTVAFLAALVGAASSGFAQAVDEREPSMVWLGVDPRLDPVRRDPRYRQLLTRIGLPTQP